MTERPFSRRVGAQISGAVVLGLPLTFRHFVTELLGDARDDLRARARLTSISAGPDHWPRLAAGPEAVLVPEIVCSDARPAAFSWLWWRRCGGLGRVHATTPPTLHLRDVAATRPREVG